MLGNETAAYQHPYPNQNLLSVASPTLTLFVAVNEYGDLTELQ